MILKIIFFLLFVLIKLIYAVKHGSDNNRFGSTFITNGHRAEPNQFPWQVALYCQTGKNQTAFCGGSLIDQQWVMTAAHCVDGMLNFTVILGAYQLSNKSEVTRQTFKVDTKNAWVHPNWNPIFLKNDIALLKLPKAALINDFVKPINLTADVSIEEVDKVATVSGWGRQSDDDGQISDYLHYINQPIISNFKCNIYYLLRIKSSHICISGAEGRSTCNGDSGGPLIAKDTNGNLKQIGIVSFGIAFGCEVGWPPVFTRVTSFIAYIKEITHLDL